MSTPAVQPRSRFAKRAQTSSPNVTACIRCRQRKKRCDQRLPRCTLCESAKVDCVIHDAVTKRTVPRSYVHNLEERVAFLELKLREHGIQEYGSPIPTSLPHEVVSLPQLPSPVVEVEITPEVSSVNPVAAAQKTVDEVLNLVQHSARQEPIFSQLLLDELMRPGRTRRVGRVWEPQPPLETSHVFDIVNDLDTSLAPLPDKKGAQYLTKIYFEFANDCYPLLHEPTFRHKLEQLYRTSESENIAGGHTSHKSKLTVFFVFMVFAMALLVLQKNNVAGVPTSLCDRYHKTALRALKEEGLPANVEGVQALLLIAQYSYHHPNIHGVWKTIGMALRLSVELGLHQDPPVGKLDFLTLDTMRRTFWVAYAMDRNIAIASGLPSCLSDGSITAKFPTDVDDEFITADGIRDPDTASRGLKSFSIYFFRYRKFQSEIQTILYEERCPALPPIDYQQWQKDMHERLKAWHDHPPKDHLPGKSELNTVIKPDVWDLAFHRALLNLYHPSPRIPSLSEPALLALAKSSCKVIQLYRPFFLEDRVTIFWQAVDNLFSAGTALLFCYINSEQVKQSINLQSLEANIHTCSSVLWGMVERFPAYKAKRDAFDIIATRTLADLNSNTEARDGLSDTCLTRGDSSVDRDYPFSSSWSNDENSSSPSLATQTTAMNEGVPQNSQPPITETTVVANTEQSQANNRDLSNSYTTTPQVSNESTQRLFDLNEISIDWEAFENANEFIPSTWL